MKEAMWASPGARSAGGGACHEGPAGQRRAPCGDATAAATKEAPSPPTVSCWQRATSLSLGCFVAQPATGARARTGASMAKRAFVGDPCWCRGVSGQG